MRFEYSQKNILGNQRVSPKESLPKRTSTKLSLEDSSRRHFLGKLAMITAAAAVLPTMGKVGQFSKIFESAKEDVSDEQPEEDYIEKVAEQEDADFDIENIQEEKLTAEEQAQIKELFDFNSETNLDMEKRNLLLRSWKKRYSSHPLYKKELEKAYFQMEPAKDTLENFFLQHDVPKEFIYLAIPESYARSKAKSHKGAMGHYQFMEKTGLQYGLRIDEKIDERTDLLKSGKACGLFLKDLNREVGDWDLALYSYNGGFARRYAKNTKHEGRSPSEEGFLEYMENIIKSIKKEVRKQSFVSYTVQKGDSLHRIAKKHSVDIEKVRLLNKIRDIQNITVGQKIRIPLTEKNREEIYYKRIAGIVENLNYVAKCKSVFELIEEGKRV